MRKTIREPVHGWRSRQADSEETATDFWIAHYAANLIQRFKGHFCVCMQKPENIAARYIGSHVHLPGTAARVALYNVIA
jgi:hypothetical protein